MENNALITFTMILPIIELCMGIANAVSVKDKIQYPINNPANIHSYPRDSVVFVCVAKEG